MSAPYFSSKLLFPLSLGAKSNRSNIIFDIIPISFLSISHKKLIFARQVVLTGSPQTFDLEEELYQEDSLIKLYKDIEKEESSKG